MTQPPMPPMPPMPPQQPMPPAPTQPMPGYPPQQPPGGYYPPPPPGGYPPPPGTLHKSGRGKTIGIIVAGVVGVGLLGGLGAVVFGGGEKDDDVSTSEAKGNGSGILDPEPIGTATPQPDPTATAEPTETPAVDPTPTPDPTEAPPVNGETVSIGSGVQIFVPSGWEVAGSGKDDVGLSDGKGSWAYALTGVDDPSVEASSVLNANLNLMLPGENYSQLKKSDVRPLEAFGSVVSVAVMDYEALWVDAQSSITLHGQVYVAVREDGVVLLISVEHSPPGDFESSIGEWGQVVDNSFNLLGGS
jgi:hypothetical protein